METAMRKFTYTLCYAFDAHRLDKHTHTHRNMHTWKQPRENSCTPYVTPAIHTDWIHTHGNTALCFEISPGIFKTDVSKTLVFNLKKNALD